MKSTTLFVFVVGVVGLIGLAQATDYCSPDLCKANEKHIACKNSGDFAKTCPKDKKLIDITQEVKDAIVKLHNVLRDNIAGGKLAKYKSAARMATMQWDDELAKLAELHVKECLFEHDECRSTFTFKHAGQNLAQTWFEDDKPNYLEILKDLVQSWWDEHADANMDVIGKFPKNWSEENPIGHFTAMARESNTRMGCGAVKMFDEEEKMDSVLLTCDYATTNMIDEKVYEDGKPASKCKTGTDPTYKNLCSPKETY